MSFELAGIGVSGGIVIGRAFVLERFNLEIPEYNLPKAEIEQEVLRLQAALSQTREQLLAVRDAIPEDAPQDTAFFINAHLLMLDDSALRERPMRAIREEQINAEWAIKRQRDRLVEIFDRMEDEYLRAKKVDVMQVTERVLRNLLGQHGPNRSWLASEHIIIADDLSPADTVLMKRDQVAAFVTDFGGPTSHTAIIARSLRLPAVVGLRNGTQLIRSNDLLVVDGDLGMVLVNPEPAVIAQFESARQRRHVRERRLIRQRHLPACSTDGVTVELKANIELPEEVTLAEEYGASGVGLYRTEFLYMNRKEPPGEEEQFEAYLRVVQVMDGHPVTIRTLDLGADKQVDGSRREAGTHSHVLNPALGLRAIRMCLREPDLFRPQLRAILRASAFGHMRMMIPMISAIEEVHQALALVKEIREELTAEGHAFDPQMPIGGMVEVPAVAMAACAFARHLDFFSIGTNDLIQYALAIDRVDDDVNYLYDPLHPGVLHLIANTIRAGRQAGIPVAMCGEMAGDPRYTRLLLGLGLQEFSMHPSAIPEVKEIIRGASYADARQYAEQLLSCM
ncbi:phosphoenolpyruvate--protein phosphotransferase [Thermithiobacillus plumbiphilus]|uniref:Phosphoenolpyruvate-protein phosphotransferase n=1 Tax=Thermithiobacillus plumbiphilus TaxID=1729899 RepID=A0ABU9D8W3_9PROT